MTAHQTTQYEPVFTGERRERLEALFKRYPTKRAALVDELLNKPEWVDKWTMYLGDLYQNVDSKPSTGLRRYPQGRNAFYTWIHDSLAENKAYNQMVTELISAAPDNTYNNGPSNFLLNAGFQVWQTLFNNFAVEETGVGPGAMGVIQAVRFPVTEVFIMSQSAAKHRSTIYGIYYSTMQYTGRPEFPDIPDLVLFGCGCEFLAFVRAGASQ